MDRLRFLLASAAAVFLGALRRLLTAMSAFDIFRNKYVPNAEAVPYHAKWVRANAGEAARWAAFRDAVLAGGSPAPPAMTTKYGTALVAAGEMAMASGSSPPPLPEPAPAVPTELAGKDIVVSVTGPLEPAGANVWRVPGAFIHHPQP